MLLYHFDTRKYNVVIVFSPKCNDVSISAWLSLSRIVRMTYIDGTATEVFSIEREFSCCFATLV